MVRRKIPAGQVNRRNNQTIEQIKTLMVDLGQKYSIKVGILQAKGGSNIVPGTDLSMADLGAVHEFGATINVTDKMRNYLHSQGLHLKKNMTTVNIPARPFLRPLLKNSGKDYILDEANFADDPELNKLLGEEELEKDSQFLDKISHKIAVAATELVEQAFRSGGYPNKWKDITKYSREHRKYNHTTPPLTDSGNLFRAAINYEVTKGQ